MKHNYISHILLCLCLLSGTKAAAYDAEIDGICYNFSGDEAEVTFRDSTYNSYSGSVEIPHSVTYNGKTYNVTNIGSSAFRECSSLTSVSIPEGVACISDRAFILCTSLTSVVIPSSVTSIEEGAFAYCSSLASVNIPEGVTSIGRWAFEECRPLTSITIPEGVTSIELGTFSGCSGLTSVTIPASMTSIGRRAFSGCSNLSSIIIPEGVTSIGTFAFSDCSSLNCINVAEGNTVFDSRDNCNAIIKTAANALITGCMNTIIPDDVACIDTSAFYGCSHLTSITIPSSVTSICWSAFCNCSSLTSITIPNNVTSIGTTAFYGCSRLTSITIPESVTSIGLQAFYRCSSLTSITIPESVTSIGDWAFWGCYFTSDTFVNNSTLTSNNNWGATLYDGEETTDGLFIMDGVVVRCRPLATSVTIPESVTSIGDWAFEGCNSLTSITIPEGVTSIGIGAFYRCSSLMEVYCLAKEVPDTHDSAFENSPIASATLYVPTSALEAYKTTAPWSGFGTIVGLTEDEIDGIEDIEHSPLSIEHPNDAIYDLSGRKINGQVSMSGGQLPKGIIIVNGKKLLK